MAQAIPVATYRVQLTEAFTFRDAAAIVPYLKRLGVTHLYTSPFLAARAGSTHGYDIVDHNKLNPELGGEEGFLVLSDALRGAGMGLVLDFVPNHMGVGSSDNRWWLDVLEWGRKSPYAASFDIDWDGLPYRTRPGVLLPILGRPYGEALRDGEIVVKFDSKEGAFAAWYFEHKLPINPQNYAEIVRHAVAAAIAEQSEAGKRLLTIADRYRLPSQPSYSDAAELKRALAASDAGDLIDKGLVAAYGPPNGEAALHRLLERQAFHLAYWRVAFAAINYRRFFDINDLAGIRPEHSATFKAMHRLVAQLIADDRLDGLRLDHIDGLRDPARYTRQLRDLVRRVSPKARTDGFYLVVEKILGQAEPMPAFPGIHGTTGYERLNLISHLLLDGRGLPALDAAWRDFSGERSSFDRMLRSAKLRVLNTMLASEFTVLARMLARIAAGHLRSRDYVLDRLRAALLAYVLEFPVYRTYVTAARTSPRDRALIDAVLRRARDTWEGPDPDIFDFLGQVVTTDVGKDLGYSAPRVRNFALKLQQFTGPLMAKALEDTTFYRHHRLLALNEVGGEPDAPDTTPRHFHAAQRRLLREQRHGLVATATHDTKRGEDARMRILSLAEIADDWTEAVKRWRALNDTYVRQGDAAAPSRGHEYMLYQALVGAWEGPPDTSFVDRIQAYALKAAREGKSETSWTSPNDAYERTLARFIDGMLNAKLSRAFIADFSAFAARPALLGALNSLSQLALKMTLPGVPDIYQGTELWDLSLVDPDNRRPVDFDRRRADLSAGDDLRSLQASWHDGRIKFALLRKLLGLRRENADLFREGDYRPLDFIGPDAAHCVGFVRAYRKRRIGIAVVRHFAPLTDGGRRWLRRLDVSLRNETPKRDLLNGGAMTGSTMTGSAMTGALGDAFGVGPVAVFAA